MLRHLLWGLAVSVSLVGAAFAQSASNKTILVLDASGSMWGQIDGVAKITIAQEVVGNLLQTIPADQALGLTAYGHNRKGDCSDIETLVPPALNNRGAIAAAVNAISPKGKTPLSESVLRAAQELRYEEDKATVILISDGVETCDFDPCAIGQQLEETGVDFTAHVVGFDVAAADQASLQCLAENTGGQFLPAENADELAAALQLVAAPPPPEPIGVTIVARETGSETDITEDILWTISQPGAAEPLAANQPAAAISLDILPGATYNIEVLRTTDEAVGAMQIQYVANLATTQVIFLPPFVPQVELGAPQTALVGETIPVTWDGPVAAGDYVSVTTEGTRNHERIYRGQMEGGNSTSVLMPNQPGMYELRYVQANSPSNGDDVVLAVAMIEVSDISTTISAPETASVGETIVVEWTGAGYTPDYISVSAEDGRPHQRIHAERISTSDNRVRLLMPGQTGTYQLRYVLGMTPSNGDDRVMATQSIEITDIETTISGPTSAAAADTISVEWSGPGYGADYISIAPIGAKPHQRVHAERIATDDNRVRLLMPGETGKYELRYVLAMTPSNGDDRVMATQEITIEEVGATISAEPTAKAGDELVVTWTGPSAPGDYISVAVPGSRNHERVYRADLGEGDRLRLLMPGTPGEYEIRYVLAVTNANGDDEVLAMQMVTVEAETAELQAPASALAGETIPVTFEGPSKAGDYISVTTADTRNHERIYRAVVRDGSPAQLLMPGRGGDYVIRYVLALTSANGDDVVVQEIPISIEDHDVSMTIEGVLTAGGTITVNWTGPGFAPDYISVAELGSKPHQRLTATRINGDGPIELTLPDQAGTYELRYILGMTNANGDDVVAERIDITVQ